MQKGLHILILAAGLGKRMKSDIPKVLHKVNGKPVLDYVLAAATALEPEDITIVVGNRADEVREHLKFTSAEWAEDRLRFARQVKQLGTGDAVACASDFYKNARGSLLILNGDTPLINNELLQQFIKCYLESKTDLLLLTTELENPSGYGRVITDERDNVIKIVEHSDASPEELKINEINSGVYLADIDKLYSRLEKLGNQNAQAEYYLPDLVEVFLSDGLRVQKFKWGCPADLLGINTRAELAEADRILRMRKVKALMDDGVTVYDPASVYIEDEVRIGRDTIVYPGVVLRGRTEVGERCMLNHYCCLENVVLGAGCTVYPFTVMADSTVGPDSSIGPFSRLRPGNRLGRKVKVGNFVEMKNTVLGDGSKSSHLTYLGDAEIGRNVNVGAGTITCNYDGWEKHKTIIKDGAFIGSNTEIVAPAVIGEGAVVAAGTTVTDDVPDNALAVSRVDQKNVAGWASKKRAKMKSRKKEE